MLLEITLPEKYRYVLIYIIMDCINACYLSQTWLNLISYEVML